MAALDETVDLTRINHRPASGPEGSLLSTCDTMFSVLEARHEDPTLGSTVTELLKRVVDDALARPQRRPPQLAALLASWDPALLAAALLEAMPSRDRAAQGKQRPDPGSWTSLNSVPARSLGSALLLGLILSACSGSESTSDSSTGGTTGMGDSAVAGAGMGGSAVAGAGAGGQGGTSVGGGLGSGGTTAGAPACLQPGTGEVAQVIDGSNLTSSDKQLLYQCFANLRTSWCDGLTQLFASSQPDQIAAVLQELVYGCNNCSYLFSADMTESVRQRLVDGMICDVPLYKGVAFPD